ncbi:MAG: sulfite exporter TauE/SafE family protein [Rhodothermales bacterium]|nr:sulfite exporter TauE/SafE family protein [Rhodothermales bacterium]
MAVEHIVLLVAGGLGAGFIAGVVGVGGGVIFAPVLYFYFESQGISEAAIAPLVIGSSLFCTLIASLASSYFHQRKAAVDWSTAARVGLGSSIAVFLMTRFVTTQPWFSGEVFKIAFSVVLLAVVGRMVLAKDRVADNPQSSKKRGSAFLFAVGSATGVVSAAAGVGGGVVLIPAYNQGILMSMIRSIGTSSATIIFVALAGVASYMFLGPPLGLSALSVGAVDFGTSLLLVGPSILSVRLGVYVAHRINRKALQLGFAALAFLVAIKLVSSVVLQ